MQPRFPKSECDRSCGTNPCLRPICQEFGTLSFHSRCVCAHAMRLGFQLVGIGSFFLVRFGFPCLFFSSTDGFPQRSQSHESTQEAIITRGYFSASMFVFGITSPDTLEQLIQDILLNPEALETPLGSPQQMRASHCSQQASTVRGTSRGLFATGRAHIKGFAVGRLSVARTDRRDLRLCLDSTIAHVDAKVWIEEKSFNPCVEDIPSAKVISHPSEGVGLTIDVSTAHKRLRIREDEWGRFSFFVWKRQQRRLWQHASAVVCTSWQVRWIGLDINFISCFWQISKRKGQSP